MEALNVNLDLTVIHLRGNKQPHVVSGYGSALQRFLPLKVQIAEQWH